MECMGTNVPSKKKKTILIHLKSLHAKIALLQETHLTETNYYCIQKLWVGEALSSTSNGRKSGVMIHLHKKQHLLKTVDTANKGCMITIHLQLPSLELRISKINTPNLPTKE